MASQVNEVLLAQAATATAAAAEEQSDREHDKHDKGHQTPRGTPIGGGGPLKDVWDAVTVVVLVRNKPR